MCQRAMLKLSGAQRSPLRAQWVTLLSVLMMVGCLRTREDVEQPRSSVEGGSAAEGGLVAGASGTEGGQGTGAGAEIGGEEAPSAGASGGADAGVSAGLEGGSTMSPEEQLLTSLNIHFISIEGGEFEMGSTSYETDERPIRSVSVPAFELMDAEVTVGQYRACVEAGRCSEASEGMDCNWGRPSREDHPINCVDWGQARTFAKWLGPRYDLPTEAEWEYAARGGETFLYAGSDNPLLIACYGNTMGGSTCPIKTKQMNGYGLFDMSGNVLEWTLDEYHSSYEGAPVVADQPWGVVPECGQVCQAGLVYRVFRGGSWIYFADGLRVTKRYNDPSDGRFYGLGFRVKRVAE